MSVSPTGSPSKRSTASRLRPTRLTCVLEGTGIGRARSRITFHRESLGQPLTGRICAREWVIPVTAARVLSAWSPRRSCRCQMAKSRPHGDDPTRRYSTAVCRSSIRIRAGSFAEPLMCGDHRRS